MKAGKPALAPPVLEVRILKDLHEKSDLDCKRRRRPMGRHDPSSKSSGTNF